MYNAFFGFSENPFSLSPDPAFFYRSEQHEEALANLVYGVQARKGFIVLSGEVGTGKTTMLECLRDYLEAQYIEFAFIFNSRINSDQFFEMIAYDLDLTKSFFFVYVSARLRIATVDNCLPVLLSRVAISPTGDDACWLPGASRPVPSLRAASRRSRSRRRPDCALAKRSRRSYLRVHRRRAVP